MTNCSVRYGACLGTSIELKRIATKAIREVLKQEKTHLNWNEQALTTLATESAVHEPHCEAIRVGKDGKRSNIFGFAGKSLRQCRVNVKGTCWNIKKAALAARKKRTIANLSSRVRTDSGEKGAAAARKKHLG